MRPSRRIEWLVNVPAVEQRGRRYVVTLVVMAAAIMQILDTTIVTVALPHMRGQLEADPRQITWVLTSYLISSGIFMPLTGFLTDRFGQRRYLMVSIAGFVAASMLCGLAQSLDQMVLFRLLQGVAGAGLVPTAQAVLVTVYPREQRGTAMAIFGVGAMVGPILGPTVGGYLTEVLNWRWTFFINLPVGALALLGAAWFLPDSGTRRRRIDWLGFAFLFTAVASLQYVLDRGAEDDWFASAEIRLLAVTSVFGFICLIHRNWELGERALFRLDVFRDRNFAVSTLMFAAFMFGMYGALALRPQMLESLLGYPALTTGLVLAPRGFGSMASMFVAGRLINRTGARPLILAGAMLVFAGTWIVTWYSPDVDEWWVIWPAVVQGLGLGLVFVPLSTVAFATLPVARSAEAAGIRQLGRTIGASLGVSLASTVVADQTQAAWHRLGGQVTPFSISARAFLAPLGLTPDSASGAAVLGAQVARQAAFIGMLDAFVMMALALLVSLPLVLLLEKGVGKESGATMTVIAET